MKFSLEMVYEIWDDAHGERIEVGEDRDGIGITEIRSRQDDGVIISRITLHDEQIPLLIQALQGRLNRKTVT